MQLSRRHFLSAAAGIAMMPITRAYAQTSPGHLRVIGDTPQLMGDIHEAAKTAFRQSHANDEVDFNYTENYTVTLQQSLREVVAGDPPDIAIHAHNNIGLLARRGLIAPLDNFMKSSSLEMKSDMGRIDGTTYALPYTLSVPVVYFNVNLVRTAGGDPENLPSTWADIIALGKRIQAPSGGVYFNYATDGSWTFMALIGSLGCRVLTTDGKDIAFDNPAGLEAMDVLRAIAEARAGSTLSAPQARQAFAAGTLGIMVDTTSRLASYEKQATGLFQLAVKPFPLKPGVDHRVPPSGGSITIMARDPEQQRRAWEFVMAEMSQPVQEAILAKTGFLPGIVASASGQAVLPEAVQKNPHYAALVPTVEVLTAWPSFPVENPVLVDREVRDALDALSALQLSPKDALGRIVASVRTKI